MLPHATRGWKWRDGYSSAAVGSRGHTELRRYVNDTASGKGAEDYGCNRAHPTLHLVCRRPGQSRDRCQVSQRSSGSKPSKPMKSGWTAI